MKRKCLLSSVVAFIIAASTFCPMVSYAAQQPGDLNNDESVDSLDFGLYRKYLLGTFQIDDTYVADLNGDGQANSIDFGVLRRRILGMDPTPEITPEPTPNTTPTPETTKENKLEYVEKVFGQKIISVDIIANQTDWQRMLDSAKEEYIKVDVVVNGTKFTDVGIRPKGNSSLSQVASSNSDRFSFRLKFDEYVKDQSCFGLESFVLNNMLGDNTYMKEYVSFDIMKTVGVKAPLFSYSDITVNGKPWGTYFAVELYNKNYEKRVFGDKKGKLYNVKMAAGQMNGGGGGGFGGFGGFGANNGGSLQYKDDNSASYADIFTNGVGTTEEADYQRVIAALKALSTGTELEKYFDVDAILRYLAAHTVTVNLDSYSSMMAQNYYIYERNGQVTILPWDYNYAWGGFMSGDLKSVINFPIDTPVSGVDMSARPLISKLFANSAYLDKYHQYLRLIVDEYFANGKFEAKIKELDALINSRVRNDATSFITYDKYQKAVPAFIKLGNLRAQSIDGQLNGSIPATTTGQSSNGSRLINSNEFSLGDLGGGFGGGGFGGGGGGFGGGQWGQWGQ